MSNPKHLHRRTFLKGLGAAVSLPLLESMTPVRAVAADNVEELGVASEDQCQGPVFCCKFL